MKVTTERLPDSRMVLNIEVDEEEVERSLQQTYGKLVQRVKIPGFRQGKAPRAILQSYLGKDAFLDEALDELAPTVIKRAIEEQKIDAVDAPEVEVVERGPVVLKATVSLKPTIELGDYKAIRLKREKVKVTPEQVENTLDELRYRRAPWEPVERPVAFNDLLTMDVEGRVDGKTVINEKGSSYSPSLESSYPVPGFAQQLEKMRKDEVKEFSLTLPEGYPGEELAGKQCRFRVAVHEIKEKNPPPLDDDFARSINDEYETLAMLREKVTSDLKDHLEAEADSRYEDQLIETLKSGARIEAPPVLREREIDHLIMDEARALAARGVRFENYLKAVGKTGDQLREDFKEAADKRVTTSLLLDKLAEAEGLKVEAQEIEDEIETMANASGERAAEVRDQLQKEEVRSSVEHTILMRKALSALKENATRKVVPAGASSEAAPVVEEKREVQNET